MKKQKFLLPMQLQHFSENTGVTKLEARLAEIEKRSSEIELQIEKGEGDFKELRSNLKAFDDEKAEVEERMEWVRKNEEARSIDSGKSEYRSVETFNSQKVEKRNFDGMDQDELLSSPEYRSSYLKSLQGQKLTEVEERALTTGASSAGAAVPITTFNKIIDKLRQSSVLFPRINVSYIPGNLSLVVANAKNAASWKGEGTDGTPKDDTVIKVTLAGYELIKLVEISAAASSMTIDAFENYITSEIGRQISIALENAILNGTGSDQPTGILTGITWSATNEATWETDVNYDAIVDGLALLPTMYHNSAVFVMNRKTLFGGVRKVKDAQGNPIFTYNPQDRAAMTILGYDIVLDDYMPDDTIILGDMNYYYMNFSKPVQIDSSREAGFKSGKITYRGLAVADGKPGLDEAFVKITKEVPVG